MEIEKILSLIKNNASKSCKKYITYLDKYIPAESCDKKELLAIVLGCNVSYSSELEEILLGKLHTKRLFGPDELAEKYDRMIKSIEYLDDKVSEGKIEEFKE